MTPTRLCIALALAVAAGTTFAQTKDKPKAADKPAASADKGRDWSKVDTNKDGLVSPEEMEAWLKANPGPAK